MTSITLWHGTTDKALASIEAQGLKPGAGRGADAWARAKGWGVADYDHTRPASVFATLREGDAMFFSKVAAELNGGEPITLKLEIPRDEFKRSWVADEAELDGAHNQLKWRTTGAIPAKYIAGVHHVRGKVIWDFESGEPTRI